MSITISSIKEESITRNQSIDHPHAIKKRDMVAFDQ